MAGRPRIEWRLEDGRGTLASWLTKAGRREIQAEPTGGHDPLIPAGYGDKALGRPSTTAAGPEFAGIGVGRRGRTVGARDGDAWAEEDADSIGDLDLVISGQHAWWFLRHQLLATSPSASRPAYPQLRPFVERRSAGPMGVGLPV